jgi:transposase
MRTIDTRRLVFIDESSAKTNMARLYGRARIGQRVRDAIPCGTWNTTTMIAGISLGGARAAMLLSGAIDGAAFEAWVREVLAPTLQPGDVVVMDNLSSHKNQAARGHILAAQALILDLPPYSPDLNPIEKMWSKVKAWLRKTRARTFDELVEAVSQILKQISIQDALGWIQSCGYKII